MNGILLVNKKKGETSRDVVNTVAKILGTKKVGHTGTLDPLATGVLVLCIGSSLKLVELLMSHDKEYIATIRLGIETDTLDITGKIEKQSPPPKISNVQIDEVLKKFEGRITQEVPKYSAIKVNGKKLYEYARAQIEVSLPIHEVEITEIKRISELKENTFQIKCTVSKGTYIRSLVRDIGHALNTYAVMTELERTRVGNFLLDSTYTEEQIVSGHYQLLSPQEVLPLRTIVVNSAQETKIRNGCVLDAFFKDEMVFIENKSHQLLAIYQQKGNAKVKPYRMF